MINANELRIGNWVKWSGCASMGRGNYRIKDGADIERYTALRDPIPLTPEILVGVCWFEKINDWDYKNNNLLLHDMTGIDGSFEVYIITPKTQFFLTVIQQVHQLQNLYFSLTGEEFPISEEKLNA